MTGVARRSPHFPLRLDQLQPRRTVPAADEPGAMPVHGARMLRPQRPLQAQASARPEMPTGLGMDSADVRLRMVQRLRQLGVRHETLLRAFADVPRHQFLDAALVTQAYEDTSLPIGHAQTISKPSVVARMIELLFGGATARAQGQLGRVLEIGTGCGYQAALLTRLGRMVVSVERIKALHERARTALAATRSEGVRLVYGDGKRGHPPNAPYDSIIAAAGGDELPQAWLDQLALGGRLVVPMRPPGAEGQVLVVVDRTEHGFQHSRHEEVNFVPLKSGLIA